jgi:hypothetical protein
MEYERVVPKSVTQKDRRSKRDHDTLAEQVIERCGDENKE